MHPEQRNQPEWSVAAALRLATRRLARDKLVSVQEGLQFHTLPHPLLLWGLDCRWQWNGSTVKQRNNSVHTNSNSPDVLHQLVDRWLDTLFLEPFEENLVLSKTVWRCSKRHWKHVFGPVGHRKGKKKGFQILERHTGKQLRTALYGQISQIVGSRFKEKGFR